ncbi:MAG: hypothetical protein WC635_14780 [Bacteriovorax sp.]|jgi:hypothetical protein
MKKIIILVLATILSTRTFALDKVTNTLAWTLANTVFSTALLEASSEATSIALSSTAQKKEALRLQNEAQSYYQSGIASLYLQNKIQVAKDLDSSLSDDESVDLLVEASQIILAE